MKILVVNCGSSSVKYQLIDMSTEKVMASGRYEKIGESDSFIIHKVNEKTYQIENFAQNHADAIKFALQQLMYPEYRVINNLDEIDAIGHRIVHGGENIKEAVLVDDDIKQYLKECADLAPLHNSAALKGIEALEKIMPGKPMSIVVDTAFHQTLAKETYLYPLSYNYYKKYGIRKYGFHGTSHKYVAKKLAEIEKKDIKDLKIITCHLGQGSSICAIDRGKSVNTSMGFTPLGGIPMVTRCGDIDPSAILYIMKKEKISPEDMENLLNKQAGVLSITDGEGISPDFREIEKKALEENERAKIAMNRFSNEVAEHIAKYSVTLGGLDYIVFTGGIGENQYTIRKIICDKLKFFGIELDEEKNKVQGEVSEISTSNSKVKVFVVPTNEELMIAKETVKLIMN